MNYYQDGQPKIILYHTAMSAATAINSNFATYVDTLGYDAAVVTVSVVAKANSQSAYYGLDTLALYEADVTTSSSFGAVAAFTGTTDATATLDLTVMSSVAPYSVSYEFDVDLRKRKRYLALVGTSDTVCFAHGICRLLRGKYEPHTLTTPGGTSGSASTDGWIRVTG